VSVQKLTSQASKKEDEDERELAPYFPQFIWLLRDFGLKLVDQENNPITSRQYLENALARPSKDRAKNEIRQIIQTVFPYRDCVTLVCQLRCYVYIVRCDLW
jgi:hypothetical protein